MVFLFLLLFITSCFPLLNNSFQNLNNLTLDNPFFISIGVFVFLFFHSIGLNNLVYEKNIIRKNNLILAFVFILLNTPFWNNFLLFFDSFILLLLLNFLLNSYQKTHPLADFFNSGLLLGVLCITNFSAINYFILIIATSIVFRVFGWRILVGSLIGFLIPFIFYLFIVYMFDFSTHINFSFNYFIISILHIYIIKLIYEWVNLAVAQLKNKYN